jgi:hypothetical protein
MLNAFATDFTDLNDFSSCELEQFVRNKFQQKNKSAESAKFA